MGGATSVGRSAEELQIALGPAQVVRAHALGGLRCDRAWHAARRGTGLAVADEVVYGGPAHVDRLSERGAHKQTTCCSTYFRQRVGGRLLRLLNPLARRMIAAGMPTGAPNVLLTVRGRRSGKPRTVPGHRRIRRSHVCPSVLRRERLGAEPSVAGEATLTDHRRIMQVNTVELPPDEAAAILRRILEPYRRSRLLRALLDLVRPPIGVLSRYRIRIDDTPEEYLAEAQRHPLFELRRVTSAP